jgi:signal transduction histidine kinase
MSGTTHTIQQDLPASPVVGSWDAMRIAQVLDNLLSNAIKYSEAGSTVIVRLQAQEDAARVQVEDQGVGIPKELLSRLFDRFYRVGTVPVQGLGLGLHIARELVREHGGRIEVASEAGKGTCFTVILPYRYPAARG